MLRQLSLLAGLAGLAVSQTTTTLQAESATLSGVTVATSVTGYSGSGYVEGFDTSTDEIKFTVTSATQQLYDLNLIYSGPYGDKYTNVVLNSAGGSQVSLPATTNWTTVSAGQVLLNAGNNTIEIQNNWGWYLIDAITLAPSPKRAPHKISTTPVNPKANADAKSLLKYLASIYGKNMLSGQQDQTSLDWVTTNVGKTPAILGVDFMDYTDSRIAYGASGTDVDKAITFAGKGGIIAFVWHWGSPVGLYNNATEPWYSGFYTAATDFNVTTALADTTNANYTLLLHDIDTIAVQLKKIESNGIPILFRPLHEAEGGWFWWGAQGPEPAKKLYRIVYDRITNYHGINNIIWVWNSVNPAWYPGDDVVDIVSADTYSQGDHGPISATYNNLLNLVNDTKIIAAAEVGSVPDPAQLIAYQADWVYFITWSGDYISGGTWNTLDYLKSVYNSAYVLTLDEIQGWKNGTGSSPTSTAVVTSAKPTSTAVVTSVKPTSTVVTKVSSSTLITSAKPTSSVVKVSSTAVSASASAAPTALAAQYSQCGGSGYTGPTACVSPYKCTVQNQWYSQCL